MIGLAGRTLDRYTLGQRVGKGGMADVYLGYDPHFRRAVAIKIFKQDNDGMLRRFMREAKLMANLHHPHLMPIYDTGECELDGVTRYYIVMPFIDGGTLGMRIRHSILSPNEASSYLFDIASALDYLHKHGIIHRDIKSTNVLLSTDELCYLSDLGVARVLDDSTSLTTTGNVLGTVDYIAPELFVGTGKADARSDIYSLGVLLFEMITGQRPFAAENQVALASMHVNQRPPMPSSLLPTISPQVERVLLEGLEKDPERRYPTATALADAFYRATKNRYSDTLSPLPAMPPDGQLSPAQIRSEIPNQWSPTYASAGDEMRTPIPAIPDLQPQELAEIKHVSSPLRRRMRSFALILLCIVLLAIIVTPVLYLLYSQIGYKNVVPPVHVTVPVQPHAIITATAKSVKKTATPSSTHPSAPTPVLNHQLSPTPVPTSMPSPRPTMAPTPPPSPTVTVQQGVPTGNLVQDPDYEVQTSKQPGPPWATVGVAGVDINLGNAYSGKNNAWIYAINDSSWSEVGQYINVIPNTTYTLSVYIHTSDDIDPNQTTFGARGANGSFTQEMHYGTSSGSYTQLMLIFNSGTENMIYIHLGFSGHKDTWVQIDNWSMHT